MAEPGLSPNQRDFFRIVRAATAVAFGITTAILFALQHSGSGLVLKFSFGVIPAFALGAVIGWFYWSFIANRLVKHDSQRSRKRFWLYSILLSIGGLICFLYPLRYVTRGNMSDVLQGIVMAFFIVGIIVVLLVAVARLINAGGDPKR
ncbi:MAG: hypothetical protein L0Y58_24455 [Verrucomicrobia subdivision 3 bacterium]|nr:hypothetical protein [Limisphaerales bacterium]